MPMSIPASTMAALPSTIGIGMLMSFVKPAKNSSMET